MTPSITSREVVLVGGPRHGDRVPVDPTRESVQVPYAAQTGREPLEYGRAVYLQQIISYGVEDGDGRTQTVSTYRIWLHDAMPRDHATAMEIAGFVRAEVVPESVTPGVPVECIPEGAQVDRGEQ
jgi:hypothetical protein